MALRATLESYSPKNLPTMGTDTPPEVGKDLLPTKMSTGALESVRFSSFATALSSTDADIDVIFPANRGTTQNPQVSLTQRVTEHDETAIRTNMLGSELEKKRPETGSEELTKTCDPFVTLVIIGDGQEQLQESKDMRLMT